MSLDIAHMWHEMPGLVRMVVAVLLIQATLSIAVVIDRVALLIRSSLRSREFAKRVGPALEEGRFEDALDIASKSHGSHLASYMYVGIRTFLDRRFEGKSLDKSATLTERALERHGEAVSENLNKGMNILASTGSTAPFVGLLGTVLGILFAFKMIAETGSGGIATIGGAIGEALVVTGLGLVVAIPTVLLFNWLSNKIGNFEAGLANAAGELVDRLEAGDAGASVRTVESDDSKGEPKRARLEAATA
ncbi:MAG: MotA/TolQ/ExbB proton channel family protein [Deltaproteobacteria bacterium]|nr:MotA/TolQ/ExbB proton channel family protein [Deltaproteobacteria bacterium]